MGIATWKPVSIPSIAIQTVVGISIGVGIGISISRPLAKVSKGMSVISVSIARISINSWAYITAGKTVWVVGNPKTISIITIVSISIRSGISIGIGIPLAKVVWEALDASVAEAKT